MKIARVGIALFSFSIAAVHPFASFAQAGLGASGADKPPAAAQEITWEKIPGKSELGYYEPDRARRMAQNGDSSIRCELVAAGTLTTCEVVAENPAGFGFGAAALRLTTFFKAAPATADRAVVISIHWNYRGDSTIAIEPAPAS